MTTYKITVRGCTGQSYAMYEDGILKMFLNEIDRTSSFYTILPSIAIMEADMLRNTGITCQALKAKSAADKIAMFVFMYQQHKGIPYRARKEERANITHVTVNEQLLNTYFKADKFPLAGAKSITDYIAHYNEIRDLAINGVPVKSSFPDVYDKGYEKNIGDDISKLQRYWQHLRDLGWYKNDGVWLPKS